MKRKYKHKGIVGHISLTVIQETLAVKASIA